MAEDTYRAGVAPRPPVDDSSDIKFPVRAPITARVSATFFSARLDHQVESGAVAPAGSTLAVHAARLTSTRERERLARALRRIASDARNPNPGIRVGVAPHGAAILAVEDLVDEVTLLLRRHGPVRARGIARLRMLLSEGNGPLYRSGRGSLAAAMRGVIAAL
ncbi:MAG: hypothetical protein QOE41_4705 [Mycobacterium sp.]|jgi:hypothetical protein|nr:hypothetical protein [Mycobacterium sp.]MDT5135394.1 hypothetical protein [Mycobacterium sp.]